MSKHGCDECGKWHDGRVGCEMTDQPLSSTLEDSRFNRFDDELIDTYFNEAGKQAIRDYIANQVEANTPTSTDDERDKETAARIREINLLLIDGKCTPEYAYERIEEIVKKQLNANQPQTDEVKPTPVGKFNYRPAVSVRSDNQPQTELDEILVELYKHFMTDPIGYEGKKDYHVNKAKQAILDWHNKQVEAHHNFLLDKFGDTDISLRDFQLVSSEANARLRKLKESE